MEEPEEHNEIYDSYHSTVIYLLRSARDIILGKVVPHPTWFSRHKSLDERLDVRLD